jgi:hypothetical protein
MRCGLVSRMMALRLAPSSIPRGLDHCWLAGGEGEHHIIYPASNAFGSRIQLRLDPEETPVAGF